MVSSKQALQFITMAAFLVILLFAPASDAAVSCNDVIKNLRPCLGYLQNGSGKPPSTCCDGAKALAAAAGTKQDKQAVCTCLKNAAGGIKAKPELVKALPGNCGISLPVPISPSVDCSKIG